MSLLPRATLLCLCLLSAPAWSQVYKCQSPGGAVSYSQQPCAPGERGQAADVRPNTLDASGQREQARRLQPAAEAGGEGPRGAGGTTTAPAQAGGPAAPSSCPSEQEIRNLETSAGSATRDARQQQALQDEVRRARQCRAGQGRYTEQDQRALRQARDEMDRADPLAREQARQRAEAIHSAADPREGDRIAAQRAAETAAQAGAGQGLPVQCAGDVCTSGTQRFTWVTAGRYRGPQGQVCTRQGGYMVCP